jgi:hypothetical protein
MMNNKYLITGCGRSGTNFMYNLLKNNDIKCGHEEQFSIFNYKNKNINYSESSWLMTPFIKEINNDDFNIIRIYRNPILVIKSFLDTGFFHKKNKNNYYYLFMKGYIPVAVFNKSEIENAAVYYIFWNKLFDININNIQYYPLNFDKLLKKKTISIYNNTYNVPSEKVNEKNQKK